VTEATLDVVGVGNALVDILANVDDEFVAGHDLVRGSALMTDLEHVSALYAALPPAHEVSGGSAANTVAGLASFGASSAFVGRVRDDQLGEVFDHDLRSIGVRFDVPKATAGAPTGRCLVLVTPDAERTMCTYLGVSSEFASEDVDESLIASAQLTYLEGYLWDQPPAKEAIRLAAGAARANGRRVALTLSDPFCVERHRYEFRALCEESIDVLFANRDEICSLFETEFDAAVERVRSTCSIAALTCGAEGSVVIAGGVTQQVPVQSVAVVVDTTGAGDLYAAGFLFGLTSGRDLVTCGQLGSLAASEVISHIGARPETSLAQLASDAGLLVPKDGA
jgi:sugar/nucleoside kinase (ribokinase family)